MRAASPFESAGDCILVQRGKRAGGDNFVAPGFEERFEVLISVGIQQKDWRKRLHGSTTGEAVSDMLQKSATKILMHKARTGGCIAACLPNPEECAGLMQA